MRDELAECILQSPCVRRDGHKPTECLKHHMDEMSTECNNVLRSYVACRRGVLDMRQRFRMSAPMVQASERARDREAKARGEELANDPNRTY